MKRLNHILIATIIGILGSAYVKATCTIVHYDKAACVSAGWTSLLAYTLITGNNVPSGNDRVTATAAGNEWDTLDANGPNVTTVDLTANSDVACVFQCEYAGTHAELEFGSCRLPYTTAWYGYCP
jgi:hypothetical protein